jgi:UDP-2,3-diacylglucosamine pyrophosphatase LpxH
MMMHNEHRYRTVFISDIHLGTKGCQAELLLDFIKTAEFDTLYLVGDIIDMWRLKQRWWWPAAHNTVVRRIMKMASRGTRVVFIPGNHDDGARQFAGHEFGGIEIALNATHTTVDGRHLLVCHGDQYDLVVQHHRLLSKAGAVAYDLLLVVNRWWNRWRAFRGQPYYSLSADIKQSVKKVCQFVSNFEQELVAEARRGGFHGVVCGHIHKSACEADVGGAGIAYYNCGDWVESCTALVEHDDGRIELVDGLAFLAARDAAKAIADNSGDDSDETDPWLQRGVAFDARILFSGDAK